MPSKTQVKDELLVERFVASFEKLDEMLVFEETDPVALQLAIGEPDQHDFRRWRPIKVNTETSALEPIYSRLPARFPRLFERLVLLYRWAEVDLKSYRLLANPPGPGLGGLLEQMYQGPDMWNCLLEAGYIQFAKGPDVDFDPVCFDINGRRQNRDYRILKIDHEEILCNNRVQVVAELAPSFERLMERTIKEASSK
jgi:hypothetical protein